MLRDRHTILCDDTKNHMHCLACIFWREFILAVVIFSQVNKKKSSIKQLICSHVASTAAGNCGVPVVVNGCYYGQASGMAPSARYIFHY